MKLPFRPPKKKKLQATTARRIARGGLYRRTERETFERLCRGAGAAHRGRGRHLCFQLRSRRTNRPRSRRRDTPQPQQAAQTAATAPAAENAGNEEKPAVPPMPAKFYRVKSGDTIARIASSNGVTAEQIIDLNNVRQSRRHPCRTRNCNFLPVRASRRMTNQVSRNRRPCAIPALTYTVVRGDTPVSIARKLHVGYDDLLRLNKIEDPKKLRIGIKLKVPVRHPAATVAQAG